ncbi:MAG: ATP-binding cassette domain-containing protein [Pseudonocardiaceae bacterium]|nr:MAG: ATP-binding cassette domain-containing protein [Pseudonocardiaceae bacterium]
MRRTATTPTEDDTPIARPVPGGRFRSWTSTFPRRLALAAVVLAAVFLISGEHQQSIAITVMVYAMCAVALTVLMGWAGQPSIMSAGLLVAGGYCAALLGTWAGLPFLLVLVLVLVAGFGFGLLAALPARRLGGIYLLLSTLAIFYLITNVGNYVQTVEKAYAGFTLPYASILGFELDSPSRWFPVCAIVLFGVYEYFRYLRSTRIGRAWILLKEHPDAARVAGIRVQAYIGTAFATTTAFHFVAGAMLAYFIGSASYDSVTLLDSVNFIVMIVLGRIGSLPGAIVGAVIISAVPPLINTFFGSGNASGFVSDNLLAIELIVFALIGIVVLLDGPHRLVAAVRRRRRTERPVAGRAPNHEDAADPAMLAVRDVSVTYAAGERAVLDVSVQLAAGSATAVICRNGAGKSSLLFAIVGFPPGSGGRITSGTVTWTPPSASTPVDLTSLSITERCALGVVFVPAEGKVFDELTVEEHLREALAPRPGRAASATSIEELLEIFPALAGRLRSSAGHLSGGERQQLALAAAIGRSAELVVIDEASLGLSPVVISSLAPVLRRVSTEFARGLLIAEQDPRLAIAATDSVVLMDSGRALHESAADAQLMRRIESVYLGRLATEPTPPVPRH